MDETPVPLVFTDRYREAVDLRVVWSEEEWLEYEDELHEVVPCPRSGHPSNGYPYFVGTAFLNGKWTHEWFRLGYLRDYLRSLLDYTSAGPTIDSMVARQRAAEKRLQEMAGSPPAAPERKRTAIKIQLED